MTTKEKFKQANKEAKATILILVLIIIFWAVSGIGISKFNITVYHTPLWVITGCFGTWIFSIAAVIYLVKKVFKDFNLEEEEEYHES